MEQKLRYHINLTNQIQSMFLLTAIGTITLIIFLSPFVDPGAHEIAEYQELVKEKIKWFIMPDRRQRIIYLAVTLLLPIAILLSTCLRSDSSLFQNKKNKFFIDGICAAIISFTLVSTLFNSRIFSIFVNGNFDEIAATSAALASLALLYAMTKHNVTKKTILTNGKTYYVIFTTCLIIQIFSFRLFNNHALTESSVWSESFDAVIYQLTEVHSGKTIMANLPSQYGLYAEFMAPLFRIIDLSILNITIVFAIMQFVSMVSLGVFISKTVSSFTIKYLVSASLIAVTFSSIGHYSGVDDAYFQYWPIRFFWPALITLQFYQFSNDRTIKKAFAISISSTLATIWNVDVGAVIFITFFAYLVSRLILSIAASKHDDTWNKTAYAKAIGLHILTFAILASLAVAYLELKSGTELRIKDIFKYQDIFYRMGFMKLAMPIYPHPWMSIISIYFLGIIYSLMLWRAGIRTAKVDSIFFLSTLGLGIFSYYEGRSHIFNLITILWPSLILTGIFSDTIICRIKKNKLDKTLIVYPFVSLSILMVISTGLLSHAGIFLNSALNLPYSLASPEHGVIQSELNFIRRHNNKYKNCVILSQRQAIYYLETKTNSPLDGPSYIQTILKSDEERFAKSIIEGDVNCVFFGIRDSRPLFFTYTGADLFDKYQFLEMNEEATMLLFVKNH